VKLLSKVPPVQVRGAARGALGRLLQALALAVAVSLRAADSQVQVEEYGGWTNAFVLRGGDCKAVVVPGVGGRILHYSVNGENIIFENSQLWGHTLHTHSNFWAGGYQIDIGPELRGIPDHEWLWQGPWETRATKPFTVFSVSRPDLNLGLQLEKEIVVDPDSGELGITQRMRNISDREVSYCLWDRTLCKAGGFAIIPLNKKSKFRSGWSIRVGKKVPEYRYETEFPRDDRVRVMDGVLIAEAKALPDAREMKIGADSDAGWIAYARGRLLFIKYFPVFADGNYSDGGNTVEFYCSDRVGELEPLSPEVALKPGQNYTFPEKWTLVELDRPVRNYDDARTIARRIPKSPFAK
jgi:hypothetical protein